MLVNEEGRSVMNVYLKIAALACLVSVVPMGTVMAETTRTEAIKLCWEKAHKEDPPNTGNDVNTSGINRGAFYLYQTCMQEQGYEP